MYGEVIKSLLKMCSKLNLALAPENDEVSLCTFSYFLAIFGYVTTEEVTILSLNLIISKLRSCVFVIYLVMLINIFIIYFQLIF